MIELNLSPDCRGGGTKRQRSDHVKISSRLRSRHASDARDASFATASAAVFSACRAARSAIFVARRDVRSEAIATAVLAAAPRLTTMIVAQSNPSRPGGGKGAEVAASRSVGMNIARTVLLTPDAVDRRRGCHTARRRRQRRGQPSRLGSVALGDRARPRHFGARGWRHRALLAGPVAGATSGWMASTFVSQSEVAGTRKSGRRHEGSPSDRAL